MWRLYRVLALSLLNPSLTEVERPIPPLKWRSGRGLKTTGQSDDSGKMKFDQLIDKARLVWESSPQLVKSYPWKRAAQNFTQLIIDLIRAVVKYLCVPLFAVSSLSELSYCAHERNLFFVPIPALLGMAIAQVSKLAAVDASPRLKDAEVPWHLILMAIFFTLLKLLGPYYPFWGRILIPHFSNGGLLRTLIMVCLFVVQKTPKGIQNGTITTF